MCYNKGMAKQMGNRIEIDFDVCAVFFCNCKDFCSQLKFDVNVMILFEKGKEQFNMTFAECTKSRWHCKPKLRKVSSIDWVESNLLWLKTVSGQ